MTLFIKHIVNIFLILLILLSNVIIVRSQAYYFGKMKRDFIISKLLLKQKGSVEFGYIPAKINIDIKPINRNFPDKKLYIKQEKFNYRIQLPIGSYIIYLYSLKYQKIDIFLTIETNEVHSIEITKQDYNEIESSIEFQEIKDGSIVYINGKKKKYIKSRTIERVPLGRYEIKILHSDYPEYVKNINLTKEKPKAKVDTKIHWLINKIYGTITFKVLKKGSEVYINNDKQSLLSFKNDCKKSVSLSLNKYRIKIYHPQYETLKYDVELTKNHKNVEIAQRKDWMPLKGTIKFDNIIEGCNVTINNQIVNIKNNEIDVIAGKHIIIISHYDYNDYTKTVTVNKNKTLLINLKNHWKYSLKKKAQ